MRATLLAVCLLAGCNEKNPNFCADSPDHLCEQVDAAAETCSATKACTTGVCKLPEGTCVACLQNTDCTDVDQPICETATNTCTGCTLHDDCDSKACLPSGACGTDTNVAYLAPQTGTDNAVCTEAERCSVFSKALATNRPFIKLDGTCSESIVLDRNVTILGEQGPPKAKLDKNSGIIVEARGPNTIAIRDVEITGNGNQTVGVSVPAGQTTTLTLERVKVSNNDTGGILIASGTVSILDSRINDNKGGGIQILGGGTKYTIVNNFIIYNGDAQGGTPSTYGGAEVVANQAGNKFEFNTVAFNQSDGTRSGGLDCSGAMVSARGNILYANNEGGTVDNTTQNRGSCTFGTNFISGVNVGTAADLGLESPRTNPFSFRLTTASPPEVRDVIRAATSCVPKDFEGDARPAGTGCDLGADELAQ